MSEGARIAAAHAAVVARRLRESIRLAAGTAGLILALVTAAAASPAQDDRPFTATVIAVYDGDTIGVRSNRGTERIRLVNIDCPEYRQPYSARARRFTSQLVFRKEVRIEPHGRDRYERLLARVIVDGTDVNEALVRNGLAWHYEIGSGDRRLAAAERTARAARTGLWAAPRPVPPWEWRRVHAR